MSTQTTEGLRFQCPCIKPLQTVALMTDRNVSSVIGIAGQALRHVLKVLRDNDPYEYCFCGRHRTCFANPNNFYIQAAAIISYGIADDMLKKKMIPLGVHFDIPEHVYRLRSGVLVLAGYSDASNARRLQMVGRSQAAAYPQWLLERSLDALFSNLSVTHSRVFQSSQNQGLKRLGGWNSKPLV